jgi:hypothetical protein
MIVTPLNTANGLKLWVADGHNEEELRQGLSLGYIEWKGVQLKIEKVQDWNSTGPGLVTKLVHVEVSSGALEKLNAIMVAERKSRF